MERSRRWIVVVSGLALIVGLGWLVFNFMPSRKPSASVDIAAHASPATAIAKPPSVSAGLQVSNDDESHAPGSARQIAICGAGVVELDLSDKAAPFNYVGRLTEAAQVRWRQLLENSDDIRERAAGLLLTSGAWAYDAVTGMPTRTHDGEIARDQLAQLAAGTNDQVVYAMAVQGCGPSGDEKEVGSGCDQISLARWAGMDIDNAAPWLEIARVAHGNNDTTTERDAIEHAVLSHRIDFYNDSVVSYAQIGMPPDTTALQQAAFFDNRIGNVGSDGYARSYLSGSYCKLPELQSALVRDQCGILAELMATKGRSTADLGAAFRIGLHIGWPEERLKAMNEETLAILRIETHVGRDAWSCDNVRNVISFAQAQGAAGEVAAGRAAIKKSGKPVFQLAQEQIQSLQ